MDTQKSMINASPWIYEEGLPGVWEMKEQDHSIVEKNENITIECNGKDNFRAFRLSYASPS